MSLYHFLYCCTYVLSFSLRDLWLVQIANDVDDDEAYVSAASGQSQAQRAVHVATRKPGKRRAAATASAAAASDADGAGADVDLQQRLMITSIINYHCCYYYF